MISCARPTMGWFGSDITDFVSNTVSDAVDDIGDVLSNVPGAKELAGAMGDFAHTAVGAVVLRAMSSAFYGSIAWTVGPQLASIAWAIPGLMRGDTFDKAWFDEVKWRTEQTAEILGADAGALIGQQLAAALDALNKQFGVGTLATWTEAQLAKAAGNIREDVARMALDKWNGIQLFRKEDYDAADGHRLISSVVGQGFIQKQDAAMQFQNTIVNAIRATPVINTQDQAMRFRTQAPTVAPPPTSFAVAAPAPRNGMGANLALGAVIVGAIGALAWWYKS